MANKGGRPTKYNQEMVDKSYEYIENYADYDDMIPSIEGLSEVLDVRRNTLYDWAKDEDKEFSNILAKLLTKQQKVLINNGLSNTFNSAITKLVLGKHGFHDKVDTDLTSQGESMKPTVIELVAKEE
ncbi:MAG: hypothetical protein H8D23_00385 [Candidatus Brocadiales bacterium]|nr:hypothetical protein [Candidatus Brocadiales bacterium]